MCCFSGPVRHVSGTKIFARLLPDGQQLLVYAMQVQLERELAMILPLPVSAGAGDDAVHFINLAGEEEFFAQLEAAFPPIAVAPAARQFLGPPMRKALPVLDVGRYVASFVPSPRDFERLDARFRLPSQLLPALPLYQDYGFAVFQLKPGKQQQKLQPMALSFTPREPRALFFPTVHVHDGSVPHQANFDHALFAKPMACSRPRSGGRRQRRRSEPMSPERAAASCWTSGRADLPSRCGAPCRIGIAGCASQAGWR